MIKLAVIIVLLFLCFVILLLFVSVKVLLNKISRLKNENSFLQTKFDNATNEIFRLSMLNLKTKRHNVVFNNQNIKLDINSILDRITQIGYNNLTDDEKDFLKKQQ